MGDTREGLLNLQTSPPPGEPGGPLLSLPPESETSAGGQGKSSALPLALIETISPVPTQNRWLVESLWAASGVGIIGATPKTGKTWLGLDFALSIAAGVPALGQYAVPERGPVLIYPAEDGPSAIRTRIDLLAKGRGIEVPQSSIHVITSERLRLDEEPDRTMLESVLAAVRPKFMLLDPLVRLHGGDENHAGHVSELLGYLRILQRRFGVAIAVTHHVSKKGSTQPGQALRGSGDLHAWGDSNAYLSKDKHGAVVLRMEHRAAPSGDPLKLRLITHVTGGISFEVTPYCAEDEEGEDDSSKVVTPRRGVWAKKEPAPEKPLTDRVLAQLQRSPKPLSQVSIRKALGVRNADLTTALRDLQASGAIESLGRMGGWRVREVAKEAEEG